MQNWKGFDKPYILSLYTSACLVYDALIKIFAVLGGTSQGGQAEGAPLWIVDFITALLLPRCKQSRKKHYEIVGRSFVSLDIFVCCLYLQEASFTQVPTEFPRLAAFGRHV